MTGLDSLINKASAAGRKIAESWLGYGGSEPSAHAAKASAMAVCLAAAVLAPLAAVPVMLTALPWQQAFAGGFAVAAVALGSAGLLAATGSLLATGIAAMAAVSALMLGLAALTGGLASPFLPLVALLPLEAALQSKSRRGLLMGLSAAAAVVAVVAVLSVGGAAGAASGGGIITAGLAFALYGLFRGALLQPASAAGAQAAAVEIRVPAPTAIGDVLDRLSGLVTLHNARGEVTRVAGLDQASMTARLGDVTGKGFLNRIHVADRIAFLDALDALRLGETRREVELRFDSFSEASQFVHVAIALSAERGADGSFAGALAQTRDISRQVADRTRAASLTQEAENANAAKTRFLAAVSHELRTPLNAIIGFSDILAREYFGAFNDERQREYVGLIHTSGEHLLSLVNTMLDMSKIEAGRYEVFAEPFAIAEVIDGCEAMLRLQASGKGVTLIRRPHRGAGEVVADRRAVQQILINLLGNAIKFTEPGGVVTVDAEIDQGRLKLVVSDTGIGIPACQLHRIGEPFMQAQNGLGRHYEGTGLGLSVVKGLVDLHGGTFAIESREGEGTVVTIDLPADGSSANGQPAEDAAATPVAFPPVLPRAARIETATRNEDNAQTALRA